MRAVLSVIIVLLFIDAAVFLLFPGRIKALLEDLSPGEFRLIGLIEGAIAAAALYFILSG